MRDISEVLIPAAATVLVLIVIFGSVFGFFGYMRYLRYKETIILAEKGLVKPVVSASRETLRWGIVITGIGLALCIGLYPLGWVISSDFLFNFGPWMLVGLLPTFFGLSLIIVYMVIKKEDANESEVEAPAATASIDDDDTMLTGTPPSE